MCEEGDMTRDKLAADVLAVADVLVKQGNHKVVVVVGVVVALHLITGSHSSMKLVCRK